MNSYFVRLRIRIIVLILLFIYFLSFVCKFIPQFLEMLASYIEEPLRYIQSTLVISKSKGPSKTVQDIRTSTYQICSIEEKTI